MSRQGLEGQRGGYWAAVVEVHLVSGAAQSGHEKHSNFHTGALFPTGMAFSLQLLIAPMVKPSNLLTALVTYRDYWHQRNMPAFL